MSKPRPLLIQNAPPAVGTLTVTAPFDGRVIAELEVGDVRHVEAALGVALAAFRDRSAWLPLHQRVVILERASRIMESEQEALALQAALEGGKPLQDSRVEVARAIDGIRLCIETIRTEQGRVVRRIGTGRIHIA